MAEKTTSSPPHLCCALYRALALNPVPVVGGELYAPGVEGLHLVSLKEDMNTNTSVSCCYLHRFNFKRVVEELLDRATDNPCACVSASAKNGDPVSGKTTSTRRQRSEATKTRGGRAQTTAHAEIGQRPIRALWAYELAPVAAAYRWLLCNRSVRFPKCCDATLVYQVNASSTLPPGLYVYRARPPHFGCSREMPMIVLDQFNFVTACAAAGGLPAAITVDAFPGRQNFSALYVMTRRIILRTHEYSNRLLGEALALNLLEPASAARLVSCDHHHVAMRTDTKCVLDFRWNSFDSMSECLNAVPKIRGLNAVVWSNHVDDPQGIEADLLSWLFGYASTLPAHVRSIDYKNEKYGVRYMLLDTDGFPGSLPPPPAAKNVSCFTHTYFEGDRMLAETAIGLLPDAVARMGSPCPNETAFAHWYELPLSLGSFQPTPFSYGTKASWMLNFPEDQRALLTQWALSKDGTSCTGIAVQHALYYHAKCKKYRLMVCHVITDSDTTHFIFRL